jgi:hypothetical protein
MSKQLNYKVYSKSHFSDKMEKEAQFRNRGDAESFFDKLPNDADYAFYLYYKTKNLRAKNTKI